MKTCLICHQAKCTVLHDFGSPAICHNFLGDSESEGFHPLVLGQCGHCSTVQSLTPIPPSKLVPRFDWITYNEPEAHLDAMTDMIARLPGVSKKSVISGISYKEDSTLRRFHERGFVQGWRLDPSGDLGIKDPRAGVEMIQERIVEGIVPALHKKYGAPDVVIVRHVIEHTHDTLGFMGTFKKLVKPDGYVVFEVPDCARAFDMLDYTTLWEDHNIYFVEPTFLQCLSSGGYSLVHFERYRAAYENCLVGVVRPNGALSAQPVRRFEEEHRRAENFVGGFHSQKRKVRDELTQWKRKGRIAAFGAGHQLAMFLNLMDVSDLVDIVIDDHPKKRGLRMPGSQLPIVGSEALRSGDIKLCLLSLSAESERKVIQKQQDFISGGGTFASIFPLERDSPLNFVAGATPAK